MTPTPLLEAHDIHKIYPNGVHANRGISFSVLPGEIHALVGENGAGKSTLMKILYGLERPTRGTLLWRGEPIHISSPEMAIQRGIGMVHQNFMLVPSFTITENIVLNREPRRSLWLDRATANQQVTQLAADYGLAVTPNAQVSAVSVGMRQRVEILKALYRGAELFILDEPTAVLTPGETTDLFIALRKLVASGKTIIFITHKLREVREISDRVSVIRDGTLIGTVNTAQTSETELARMMVGRDVLTTIDKPPTYDSTADRLVVRDLHSYSDTLKHAVRGVSFEVRSGEILGIAGVEGNGQTELIEALTGLRAATGSAQLNGQELLNQGARIVREAGISHIPEDRLKNGAALPESIEENLIVDRYRRSPVTVRGLLNPAHITAQARRLIDQFGVAAPGGKTPMKSLSGGNMQKVIIARELSSNPQVLIASQPTRGVDIGAIEFIHAKLIEARNQGMAILLVSAELSEVLKLSDRLLVMYEGRIAAELTDVPALTEAQVGLYMTGAAESRATP